MRQLRACFGSPLPSSLLILIIIHVYVHIQVNVDVSFRGITVRVQIIVRTVDRDSTMVHCYCKSDSFLTSGTFDFEPMDTPSSNMGSIGMDPPELPVSTLI